MKFQDREQTTETVTITRGHDGKTAYQLIQYPDGSYELYRAEIQYYDDGCVESGPRLSSSVGMWEQITGGMGFTNLEDEVDRYFHESTNEPTWGPGDVGGDDRTAYREGHVG